MKRWLTIILICASTLCFVSCFESPFCKGATKNTGSILRVYNEGCLQAKIINNGESIVRSERDLDTSFCKPAPGQVNFNEESVICKEVNGGCQLKIISRDVTINHSLKQYVYAIRYKNCGMCKRMALTIQRVVVPKIPDDYQVIFKLDEK